MSALSDAGIRLASGSSLADVDELVTKVSLNSAPGTVAELSVELVDPHRALAGSELLQLGTSLTWNGTLWQVGSVDTTMTGSGALVTVAARSQLAKRLRRTTGTRAARNVTPAQWITRHVKSAGGKAIVERGAKRRTIVQKRGQSVLDVIAGLADATQVQWVELDGVLIVGTAWWAYNAGPALPTWPVTWGTTPETDAMSLSGTVSDDDTTQGAFAALTLPYSAAHRIRAWHRVRISEAGEPFDGVWLVDDITIPLVGQDPVSLKLTRPLKSAPKKGSAKASSGSTSSTSHTVSGGVARPYASTSGISSTNGGTAQDYAMAIGTPLYAVRDGYVISCRDGVRNHATGGPSTQWPAAANYVLLGVTFDRKPARLLYWHLSPGLKVRKGQKVNAGDLIGYSGNTGHSTGPHTHFQAAWGHADSRFGGSLIYPPSRLW